MGRRCGTHCAPAALRSDNRSESEHTKQAHPSVRLPAPRPALLGTARGDFDFGRAIAALGLLLKEKGPDGPFQQLDSDPN